MAKQHYVIDDLESMKESTAAAAAEESTTYKGYNVYFIDLKDSVIDGADYFGYSMLVYKNNRPIKYAWQYQLHHNNIYEYSADNKVKSHPATNAELKKLYLRYLTGTERGAFDGAVYLPEDMKKPLESYRDFERRLHWLNNYYPLECDSESLCYIGQPDPEQAANLKRCVYKTKNKWHMEQYANATDAALYDEMHDNLDALYDEYMNSLEGFRAAIRTELANHEACITCDYSEALAALGYRFNNLDEKRQAIVLEELKKQIHNYNAGDDGDNDDESED